MEYIIPAIVIWLAVGTGVVLIANKAGMWHRIEYYLDIELNGVRIGTIIAGIVFCPLMIIYRICWTVSKGFQLILKGIRWFLRVRIL